MCYSNRCAESRITGMVAIELHKMQTCLFCLMSAYLGICTSKYFGFQPLLFAHLHVISYVLLLALMPKCYWHICLSFHPFLFKFILHLCVEDCVYMGSVCLYRRYIAMYMCEMLNHFHSGLDFTFHMQTRFCYFMLIFMFYQCPCPLFARHLSYFNFLQNTVSQLVLFLCRLVKFGEGHFAPLLTDWMGNSSSKILVLQHKDCFLFCLWTHITHCHCSLKMLIKMCFRK